MIKIDSIISAKWRKILKSEFSKEYFKNLNKFLIEEDKKYNLFPEKEKIFAAINKTEFDKVKIIILGQDPYHGVSQANGLAFAVNPDVKKPPSLKNIEKELGKEADIESWAKQGVLMLNAALTVREKTPESHMKFWEPYTASIIEYLNTFGQDIIFVAWGAFALKQLENVNTEKHGVLVSAHPSPLGANRGLRNYPAFIGSDVFNKINSALTDKGIPAIVW